MFPYWMMKQNPFQSGYFQSYNPYGMKSPQPYGGSFTPYRNQQQGRGGYGYGYGGGMPAYFGRMGGQQSRNRYNSPSYGYGWGE